MSTATAGITIDMDSGGTFTDAAVAIGDEVLPVKVRTTPHDLTICFRDALAAAADRIGVEPAELLRRVVSIRYSTTLGTNTIIQRNGPRLGLLARDEDLPLLGDAAPETLIGALLAPTGERVRGIAIGEELDEGAALRAIEELLDNGAERLVVAIADDDGAAEREIKRILLEEYPRHILGALPVLFSSELSTDLDVERRINTALLNAYLHPELEHFLYEAEDILRREGYGRPLLIFCNDGTSNRVAKVTALKTHSSGPAGGLEGAAALARELGLSRVATADIGGTSTDVAFIVGGELEEDAHGSIEGVRVSLPMRRVDALGGGGGTIAHVHDGHLQLGPHSAGAAPGPACFGFGGTEATVTDADLVLGYFDPERFAGRISLDPDRAWRALETGVAQPLDLTVPQAASLVRTMLERRVGDALRRGVDARGGEPADWVLMAYGGAGPVHAAGIAECAGITRVLIPSLSSVLSAFGIGFSDVEHRYRLVLPARDHVSVDAAARDLEQRAIIDMRGEGFSADQLDLSPRTRLLARDRELVALNGTPLDDVLAQHPDADRIAVELSARARLPHIPLARHDRSREAPSAASTREIWWEGEPASATPVYDAEAIDLRRARIDGPAVVQGDISTIVVPPGWTLDRDEYDQFLLTREA